MLSDNDLELLSAYIDGALNESERAALEARLATDAELRRELARLRATVELVNSLPTLAAPRDFTLTPRMVRRPPTILTSAAFSALSAAAAVVLLVVGAALFTTSIRLPQNNLASNAVVIVPTTLAQTAQDGLQAEVDEAAREQSEDASVLASPSPEPTLMMNLYATQPAQESPADMLLAPTITMESMMFAAPESATLAEEQDDFADAAAGAAANQQRDGEGGAMQSVGDEQTAATELRSDEPSPPPASIASGITEVQPPAPGEAPMAAQMPSETATPAPTFSPTGTPTLMPSATPSPTVTATSTAAPTLTPTLTPTATPPPMFSSGDPAGVGVGLIIVALVLLLAAVVTTILRRRA